jgi:hypothetical protein
MVPRGKLVASSLWQSLCPSQAHEDDAHLSMWIVIMACSCTDLDDECHPSYGLALPMSSSGYACGQDLEGRHPGCLEGDITDVEDMWSTSVGLHVWCMSCRLSLLVVPRRLGEEGFYSP